MNTCEKYAAQFNALGHPVRLALFLLICECKGTLNVYALVGRLNEQLHSHLNQSTVSHHLKWLREAGLIEADNHWLERFYVACPDALAEMAQVIKVMSGQEVSA